jgi:hypothetical protein
MRTLSTININQRKYMTSRKRFQSLERALENVDCICWKSQVTWIYRFYSGPQVFFFCEFPHVLFRPTCCTGWLFPGHSWRAFSILCSTHRPPPDACPLAPVALLGHDPFLPFSFLQAHFSMFFFFFNHPNFFMFCIISNLDNFQVWKKFRFEQIQIWTFL